jgi:hypothetical protein
MRASRLIFLAALVLTTQYRQAFSVIPGSEIHKDYQVYPILCLCLCMFVCYVYVYVYVYVLCMCMCMCMFLCMCVCVSVCVCMLMCVCVCVCKDVCRCALCVYGLLVDARQVSRLYHCWAFSAGTQGKCWAVGESTAALRHRVTHESICLHLSLSAPSTPCLCPVALCPCGNPQKDA